MRLAQLARKLSIKPSAIVAFMAEQSVVLEDNANTKIEDAHVSIVINHFAPTMLEAEVKAIAEQVDEPQNEIITIEEVVVSETSLPDPIVTESLSAESTDTESQELPDIIRAPKVELSGLKVLGKIELPEKKKKEEVTADANAAELMDANAEQKPKGRERKTIDRKRTERPKRNPLAEARERELREAEERKKAEEEKRKELRKQNYLKTRQAKVPARTEKTKVAKEPKKSPAKKQKQESVGLFTRFMRWLTSNQ